MDLFSNDPNISDQIGKTTHNMLIHSQFVKLHYGTPIYSILNSKQKKDSKNQRSLPLDCSFWGKPMDFSSWRLKMPHMFKPICAPPIGSLPQVTKKQYKHTNVYIHQRLKCDLGELLSLGINRHILNDWDVQSPPKCIVFGFQYNSQFRWLDPYCWWKKSG